MFELDQIAWKAVGSGDDRLQRRPDESVAMSLAAGQRPAVAAQKWKMRRKFLA